MPSSISPGVSSLQQVVRVQMRLKGDKDRLCVSVSVRVCVCNRSCLTLCNPMDCSPPGSSVHGILQARMLEWAAISFSRGLFPTQTSNLRLLPWQADSLPSEPLKWSDAQIKKGGECHSREEKEPQEARFLKNPTLPLKTNQSPSSLLAPTLQ